MERKNPDYSNSVVGEITNPPEIKVKLDELRLAKATQEQIQEKLKEIPDYQELLHATKRQVEIITEIHDMIDQYGNYQDTENGNYALRQVRKTPVYDPVRFQDNFPREATYVLIQTVDAKAVDGLIRGNVLNKSDLEKTGALTYKEVLTTIIK